MSCVHSRNDGRCYLCEPALVVGGDVPAGDLPRDAICYECERVNLPKRCERDACQRKPKFGPPVWCDDCGMVGESAMRRCNAVKCEHRAQARFASGGTFHPQFGSVGERPSEQFRVPRVYGRFAIEPAPIDPTRVRYAAPMQQGARARVVSDAELELWCLAHPWTARLEPSDQRQAYQDFQRRG